MSKKNLKVEGYAWIGESGVIDYGFYFGDADEPISFSTTLKEIVRTTLEAYRIPSGGIAEYHLDDMKQLSKSLQAATHLVDHEIKRLDDMDRNA
jgi:hypothetical protein